MLMKYDGFLDQYFIPTWLGALNRDPKKRYKMLSSTYN